MDVSLNSDAQKFIDDQIGQGRFHSASEVLEEALRRMMIESIDDLDDDTAAAINRAEAQLDRGEGMDFNTFASELRRRIARN